MLIVAGNTALTPAAFMLSFYTWFRLSGVRVDLAVEPHGWLLLAADLGLAAGLYWLGIRLIRTHPAR